MQHVTDTETSKTFIQDVSIFKPFGTMTHKTLDAFCSKRCVDLLQQSAVSTISTLWPSLNPEGGNTSGLYHFHTHSNLTKISSSYQNIGNAYHFDTSNSFELELNQVPSKGKVGISATSTRLDVSSTRRNETRSPEMSVICYTVSRGRYILRKTVKTQPSYKPASEWHSILCIAYCAQHCA